MNLWGFPGGSDGKESTCNEGDLGLIPALGRSPGGGHGNPPFLPGDSPWTQEPVGCRPWGCKESYMVERLSRNAGKVITLHESNVILQSVLYELFLNIHVVNFWKPVNIQSLTEQDNATNKIVFWHRNDHLLPYKFIHNIFTKKATLEH